MLEQKKGGVDKYCRQDINDSLGGIQSQLVKCSQAIVHKSKKIRVVN